MIVDMPLNDVKAWLKEFEQKANAFLMGWSFQWEIRVHFRFINQGKYKFIVERDHRAGIFLPAPVRLIGEMERVDPSTTHVEYEIVYTDTYLRLVSQYTVGMIAIILFAIFVITSSFSTVLGFLAFAVLANMWADFLVKQGSASESRRVVQSIAAKIENLQSTPPAS